MRARARLARLIVPSASTPREAAAGRRRRGKLVFACTPAGCRSSIIGCQRSQTGLGPKESVCWACLGRGGRDDQVSTSASYGPGHARAIIPEPRPPPEAYLMDDKRRGRCDAREPAPYERRLTIMTRTRWVLLVAAVVALVLAGLLWWITTEGTRQLDGHIRQALESYERAFARDGAGATPTPLPLRRDGYGPLLGAPSVKKVTVHRDGQTLTAEFTGGKTTGPCGADYTARAVESAHAALIVVEEHPHERGSSWDCLDVGFRRQVIVRLSRPLGERVVLEAMKGMPAPVDLMR